MGCVSSTETKPKLPIREPSFIEIEIKEPCNPVTLSSNRPEWVTSDIKPFTLKGETCLAYVISVYDGDTFTLGIKSSHGLFQWKCRTRYDTPEVKINKIIGTLEEKAHGLTCRDLMKQMILGKVVTIYCYGSSDKYGRQLIDLYGDLDHISQDQIPVLKDSTITDLNKLFNLSKWMVENTPAYEYDGKAKHKFYYTRKFPLGYQKILKEKRR